MNDFEKSIINSSLDIYAGIKNIDVTGIDELKAKVSNTTEYQTMILKIDNYDTVKSSQLVTFDYVNEMITNEQGTSQYVITNETGLSNLTLKSFKIITADGVLTSFTIEVCTLFNGVSSPVWKLINNDELSYSILNNTELRFRISIPTTKSLRRIYAIYQN